jgi:outer membrane usher protein FimD/PapC
MPIAGIRSRTLDEQNLTLKSQAPAQAFEGYALEASQPVNPEATVLTRGAFLNYDVMAQKVDARSNRSKDQASLSLAFLGVIMAS